MMDLFNKLYNYDRKRQHYEPLPNSESLKNEILATILADNMAPFYTASCQRLGWSIDEDLLLKMRHRLNYKILFIVILLAYFQVREREGFAGN